MAEKPLKAGDPVQRSYFDEPGFEPRIWTIVHIDGPDAWIRAKGESGYLSHSITRLTRLRRAPRGIRE